MAIEAKVLADSVADNAERLISLQIRTNLIIWPEMLTHAMIERNARSMRAAPSKVFLREVMHDPAIPVRMGRNQRGMQDAGPLTGWRAHAARAIYRGQRWPALVSVWTMYRIGAHKQVANRLLTPWAWVDAVLTATGPQWDYFMSLRDHDDADPTMRATAVAIRDAIASSKPRYIRPGYWHVPYSGDLKRFGETRDISAARCARVSHKAFDGSTPDRLADLRLSDKLKTDVHLTPFGHQARPVGDEYDMARDGKFKGWRQYRKVIENDGN